MKEEAIKLLRERSLRVTSHRLSILSILLEDQTKAFSAPDLLKELKEEMNASTIYRALEALNVTNLLAKKTDADGSFLYIINLQKRCAHRLHPHLKCEQCGALECLPPFPQDYAQQLCSSGVGGLDIVLRGTCSKCRKRDRRLSGEN